jgi:2-O-methyltransferase
MAASDRIRYWTEQMLRPRHRPVVLELGAHEGEDTRWLVETGARVHAFEADPRNIPPTDLLQRADVCWNAAAVADRDGVARLIPSARHGQQPWTESSSILRPTGHITKHPSVTFGQAVEVPCLSLDSYCARHGIVRVDLIWADVQGAEALMIAGGRATFARTDWCYTECSDVPLYESQPSLKEILAMLGPAWSVWERVDSDNVLLRRSV